jgi:arginine utilization regulatory protein
MNRIEAIINCLLQYLDEGIQIVDSKGRTIYYNEAMGRVEGLEPDEVIGKRAIEFLKGVEEDSSTLMNALKCGQKYVDVIQHYSSHLGKEVTTINTTVPVIHNDEVIAAIEISKDMTQLKELNEKLCKLQASGNSKGKYFTFKDIMGTSQCLKDAINKAMRASLSNSSVLIYGETGCGKELFAQSIHYSGLRKDKPFIAINCAAIPSNLLEAVLFGTVKGSFTGSENKKGLFEDAHGGTLLLDEINSMDPALQSKLLRVLQDGYIRPIGSNSVVEIDVRIIATLNENPEDLMKEGKLRKDFYYRLSVIKIDVPPLRERQEDILHLSRYFIKHYNRLLGKNVIDLSNEAASMFLCYSWPGNVRELKNIIEASMNMIDTSSYITKEYIDNRLAKPQALGLQPCTNSGLGDLSLEEYMDNIERQIINDYMKIHDFNISKTAASLKISRQNLQHKIKKYKLL